nr:hypothetical protein PlMoll_1560 [uncultured Mycoplasmataceae bacterium]
MSNTFLIIILLIALAVGIPWWLKKKKEKNNAGIISSRRDKDEVWKTVKQFLKDENDYGKEIVDSYVAKRNPVDYINPNSPSSVKKNLKYVNKIREEQVKQANREAKKTGDKPKFQRPKVRDLYVVCFVTKSIKTGKLDAPRAIEVEVVNNKISKKEWDRKILINQKLDYDTEMEWIAPIRFAEDLKTRKANEAAAKKEEKAKQKRMARVKKQEAKVKKQRSKKN